MSGLTQEQAKKLDDDQTAAIANLARFNYAYTPAPIAPFPSSMGDMVSSGTSKKFVNITPIGTYAPNDSGDNPVAQYMSLLPDKQTPETCIANAAMIKSRTTLPDFNNTPITGTAKTIDKQVKSKQLIRNAQDRIEQYTVIERKTLTRNEERTGITTEKKPTLVYIDGLHFRATRHGSGYMGDNPNYFRQNPDRIEIDTSNKKIFTDDLYLPTDFGDLKVSTTTNVTSDKSEFNIYPNMICTYDGSSRGCQWSRPGKPENVSNERYDRHYFAVEWSGFFKPNKTGEWVFTTDSDDVSFLWVDSDYIQVCNNITVDNSTVNNRGLHGMDLRSSDGRVKLNMTEGLYYRIIIQFSENGGGYGMSVTARCKNGGPIYSNFKGLFFSEVTKMIDKDVEYKYIEKDVPYEADVPVIKDRTVTDITYSEGDLKTTTVSMGDMFNPTYNITDGNAVYVSMVKDPKIPSTNPAQYDCYINDKTKVHQLNTVFGQGTDRTPIYNTINIWQSNTQGNVDNANGFCKLDANGVPTMDNDKYISIYSDENATKNESGNVPDEIPIMYIAESSSGNVNAPQIVIYNKSKKTTNIIGIGTDNTYNEIMEKCRAGELVQAVNKTWIGDEARVLAYSSNSSEPNVPEKGIIYKITSNTALISPSQIFRLILINGKLTLQMAVNPTKIINDSNGNLILKYTQQVLTNPDGNGDINIIPNTFSLLKIDVDHRINSLNLLDRSENKSYFVPNDYAVLNNSKYSKYNTYPSSQQISDGNSHVATKAACETSCTTNNDCMGYYTYNNGSTTMCSLIDVSNPPAQLFNPQLNDATSGELYMKNKTINPQYNKDIYAIKNVAFTGANNTQEQKRAYYPNQTFDATNQNCSVGTDGKLSCDPGFEYLKELVRITTKNKSDALSKPIETGDITAVEDTYKLGTDLIVNTSENFTNYMEAYTPLNISSGSTDNISIKCIPGYTGNTYGLCTIKDELNKINDAQDKIQTNSAILNSNYGKIKEKVTAVDTKFKTLSNDVDNNNYKYDFNDYDDKPDTSMLGAIERDTNVLLLHENSMYIVGTIITTSLAILGVILARS